MSKGILFVILSCLVLDWAVAIIVWITMLNPLRQEFVEGFKRGYNETKEQQTQPVDQPGPAGQDDRIVGMGGVQKEAPKPQDIPVPRRKPVPSVVLPPTMTLAAYLAQHPTQPARIQVFVRLGNYYNYAYGKSQATHYSISMTSSYGGRNFGPFNSSHAWVAKNSAAGRTLFELLKDGDVHYAFLTVALVGPDGKPTPPDQDEMLILSVERD